MATSVITPPINRTVRTQPGVLGNQSDRVGISRSKGIPTAVAETAIIDPARKQNIKELTRLYQRTTFLPAIRSN